MPPPAPGREPSGEAGFALLVAILFLMIVTTALAPFVLAARTRFDLASDATRKVRLDILADGLVTAVARELAADASPAVSRRSVPAICRTPAVAVEARVQDQRGLVSLNGAPEPLLAAGLVAVGLDRSAAEANARAILAYREPPPPPELAEAMAEEEGVDPGMGMVMGLDAPDPALVLGGFKQGPFEFLEELYDFPALQGVPLRRLAETFTLLYATEIEAELAPLRLAPALPPPEAAEAAPAPLEEEGPLTYRVDVFVRSEADATLGYGGATIVTAGDGSAGFVALERLVNPNLLPGGASPGTALSCDEILGPAAAVLRDAAG